MSYDLLRLSLYSSICFRSNKFITSADANVLISAPAAPPNLDAREAPFHYLWSVASLDQPPKPNANSQESAVGCVPAIAGIHKRKPTLWCSRSGFGGCNAHVFFRPTTLELLSFSRSFSQGEEAENTSGTDIRWFGLRTSNP